jgi:hypothetical protein
MADDGWYSKLAKSGWLGTKAQVSAEYGSPAWGSDNSDPKAKAIKSLAQKKPTTDVSESGS